jgi:hypothetical protein
MLPIQAFRKLGKKLCSLEGKAKAPPAPDYTAAAKETSAGNLEAARATAAANKVNQVTPYGNLTYTANPNKDAYGNTLYTATQTLSPDQQSILNANNQLDLGLMNTANTGLGYANKVLSQPGVDTSKLTQMQGGVGAPSTAMKSSVDTTGLPSYGINPGETYTDAIMRRLQPQLEGQRATEEARLANQGIGLGSSAYSNAKDILGRQQNDLLTSAQIQGMNTGLQANQQQFGQNATQAQLANQANQQEYNQQLQNAQLANQVNQQGFQQEAYNQMQPINVINALRTGSQVTNPSYANVPQQANTAGADILGATQAGYNAQLGAVNAKNAASGNFMGGLMQVGTTAAMMY